MVQITRGVFAEIFMLFMHQLPVKISGENIHDNFVVGG